MEQPIIEVRNIGKKYDIAHMRGGYIALRDVIANVFKNPGAFIAHKAKRAVGLEKKEEFWALRGANFTIKKGEVVGIIGSNGAGKSTLLKILSQITPPTEGEIIIRGRVGSLLEVGTGFHPELTGRENIFLNGAILGMKKEEIARKFDQIVAFAGVDKFLDTPVKHYSSGMYVRLAFSVAAHMDPDILLVDEVLAVGDAEFQKKCLGKMDEITKSEGRTILFVSHNMGAIKDLCPKTILLEKGRVAAVGPTEDVIKMYNRGNGSSDQTVDLRNLHNRRGSGAIRLTGFRVENKDKETVQALPVGEDLILAVDYETHEPVSLADVEIGFSIARDGQLLSTVYGTYQSTSSIEKNGKGQFRLKIKKPPFSPGMYGVGVRILLKGMEADWPKGEIGRFEITNSTLPTDTKYHANSSIILAGSWSHLKLD